MDANARQALAAARRLRLAQANPESVLVADGGHQVELKVHRCLWSGDFIENSLAAIQETYQARVAHAEIDIHMLADEDFIVLHDEVIDRSTTGAGLVGALHKRDVENLRLRRDGKATSERAPLFSEIAAFMAGQAFPTLVELDMPGLRPLPWKRLEDLVALVDPVRDRVMLNGPDWNMRRLLHIDPTLPVACGPELYLDWVPEPFDMDDVWPMNSTRGAYGYFDRHPLAQTRDGDVRDYLFDRVMGIHRLVPAARETHFRVELLEHILDDGYGEVVRDLHALGMLVDAWTLNADTPPDDVGAPWLKRLRRLVGAGVDMVSSDTPRVLANAWHRT
jgi:glycerophosphoryl diester phosphodiesterase